MSGSASAAEPDRDRDVGQGGGTTGPAGAHQRAQRTADDDRESATPAPDASQRSTAAGHGQFLITSAERDAAEARLRDAVADEVLSLEEFGDRMRLLLAARTRAELHAAIAGLPQVSGTAARTRAERDAAPRPAGRVREGGSAIAILSNAELKGRWRPGSSTTAVAVLGEATVDLQGVEFEGDELVISAVSALGTVEIIVPEGVDVDLRGIAVLGDRTDRTDHAVLPDAPVVRIDGLALLGDVTVRHPKPKERMRLPDGRGAFSDRVPLRSPDSTAVRRQRTVTPMAAVRRWMVGALVAVALAMPLGWTLSADTVAPALFGSNQQTISTSALTAGEEVSVGAPVAFGSVEIRVPEGVNVERNGMVVFGSSECGPCGTQAAAAAPTVTVRTVGAFGSVEITRLSGGAP